jgi:hypothetical protein
MTHRFCASAALLAALIVAPAFTAPARAAETSPQLGTLTEVNISQIKSVLHLTPAQLPYWRPVESALMEIAHRQAQADGGVMSRISSHVVTLALNSSAIARLTVAARPLIKMLDSEQKQTAMMLAQQMNLGPALAGLN